ncbi:DNA mismatch repair protein-like protein msh3 [Eremomyces bilateralis CBS 781.70]|uniref:MutS protein homolog 3 n=1 Tax=Eremomyces bilateralis CBS 781.70 TaxID=1392243 RepID=A0A6G1GCQ4_9PEZI|nr:DNA mismatch repair protein-like protein msh3 [Eremomyces bilateralis CBS 781.70]KAF1815875.1 DNA mismatch repair protein-like protein msh3 [Eremomyces bilateralis CBS 781.70]
MAPNKQGGSSQPQASQSKKQQSISSFFTPKSTPRPAAVPSKPALASSPIPNEDTPQLNGTAEESSDNESNQRISKGSRRSRAVIDDDSDVENAGPNPKRSRTSEPSTHSKKQHAVQPSLNGESLVLSPSKSKHVLSNGRGHGGPSGRTSRYVFSSSPADIDIQDPESDDVRSQKERLHQKFVKRLGKPDSIAELKRRNRLISEETADLDGAEQSENEDAPDPAPKSGQKGKKAAGGKKKATKLTPMEVQVLDIKHKHPDTVLVVEVGYKFRFFGEDARIAAKELGIVCIPGKFRYDEHFSEAHLDRFASASIPVHRLHVHVKRLVAAGHKVGVVRQIETAALKAAGDNRNAPFVRKLTNLYTKATYVDDMEGISGPMPVAGSGTPSSGYILCLTETNAKGWGTDEKVQVGIVAVQPATGDIIYDDFEDGFMRAEIETRLLHIAPSEFLIVGDLSNATEKMIKHLTGSKSNVFGDQARIERIEKSKTAAAESYNHISNFYAEKFKASQSESNAEESSQVLDKVHQLSEHVTISLSALINHLSEYGLEHVFDLTKYFQPFSSRTHMLLNGNTLTSLEIFQNQTDYSEKGSLFWTVDRTKTRFGHRLLKKWVGRPLLDRKELEERVQAVEELKDGQLSAAVEKVRQLVKSVKSDLEKILVRVYYKKSSRPELLGMLQTLQRVSNEYADVTEPSSAGFSSTILNELVSTLPRINDCIVRFLEQVNAKSARDDEKYTFFREEYETEAIKEHKNGIKEYEEKLDAHRADAAATIKKSKVNYMTSSGIEYLIEVENNEVKKVPASWIKISGTKRISRFHTPEVVKFLRKRDQHKESLAAACDDAFKELLEAIGAEYQELRDTIHALATLDCLLSLAEIANQPGYSKPTFIEEPEIRIAGGRHPMVEQLLLDAYVPNDIKLRSGSNANAIDENGSEENEIVTPSALLITGPNMGGKSSYVRQTALISILAQIGSYIPAESAELTLLDAVFTRMGANDNMMKGESTFMVELGETAEILRQATPRSLVLLDELGRGTSTHDGCAIAEAVCRHIVEDIGCMLLFVTHYQLLGLLAGELDGRLQNVHMKFKENTRDDGEEVVTFLYEVGEGMAHRSYGLNVARLANVPRSVVDMAAVKSKELEESTEQRRLQRIFKTLDDLRGADNDINCLNRVLSGVEQL